jgi:hypothetical protein
LRPGRDFVKVETPRICPEFESLFGCFLQLIKYAQQKNGSKTKVENFGEEITGTEDTTPKNCPGLEFR